MNPHYVLTANCLRKFKNIYRNVQYKLYCAIPVFITRHTIILFSIILLNTLTIFAGNEDGPIGARSSGISHASVTIRDGWSCFNNQAGLGYLQKPSAGIYFENRYNVKELSNKAAYTAYPFKPGTIAINYKHFGYSKYYESKVGLAFGRKLFKHLAAGVQVNYLHGSIAEEYGSFHAVAAEIGLLSEPLENLFIGFHVFNPAKGNSDNTYAGQLQSTMRFGISYLIENNTLVAIETVKDRYNNPFIRMGMEIKAINNLFARLGFTTSTSQYTLGLGYSLKRVTADISYAHNNILGYSPQVSVIYNW